jgi:aspartate aminotransferase
MSELAEAVDRDLVRLEVREPDFDTPRHVVAAADLDATSSPTRWTRG